MIHDSITQLLAEAEAMDENCFPPRAKAEESDKRLGEVPVQVRKLYALSQYYQRELDEKTLASKYGDTDDATIAAIGSAEERSKLLRLLFWYACRSEFNVMSECSVGLREGWVAVSGPCNHRMPPFLKNLLGGQ